MAYRVLVKCKHNINLKQINVYSRTLYNVWDLLYFGQNKKNIPERVQVMYKVDSDEEICYDGSYAGCILWMLGIDDGDMCDSLNSAIAGDDE